MKAVLLMSSLLLCIACSKNFKSVKPINKSPYLDTLTDANSGANYFIDTSRTFVYAFNKNGELLWKTDPWEDNNLKIFGDSHPEIAYFKFESGFCDTSKEIEIGYCNKLGGCLNKLTGKFDKIIKD
jgi:hypothetical protein